VRPTVLIIGATGRVGAAVLAALDALPEADRPHLRALARRPDAVAPTTNPIAIVAGDLRDTSTLKSAISGVDTIFLMTGDSRDQVSLERGVIAEAVSAGRPRIVKLSAITAGLPARPSFGAFHGAIEDDLRASGLPFTILRPAMFFQSLELFADPVKSANRLIAPAGSGSVAMIDIADVAAVATSVITQPDHEGKIYTLTGAAAPTMADVAAALSKAMGRTISYISPPLLMARLMMRFAGGMDWWLSGQIVDLFSAIRKGAEAEISGDVPPLLGRPQISLETYFVSRLDFWLERR
jgi:NAD(P)H dehydrogenase (quinone)